MASSTAQPGSVVAVTRAVPAGPIVVPGATVRHGPAHALPREEVLRFVAGSAVVVSMFSDRIDDEFLDAAGPGLRGICHYAVGMDAVDLEACRQRGVIVTSTPDAVTEGTANMAIGLMLAVARRILEGDRFVRSGGWARAAPLGMADMLGPALAGRTLLIVGAGRIGTAVALRARAFGMDVLYASRSRSEAIERSLIAAERIDLDAGLARADVVSLHTPLTPDTRHLLDRQRIGLLPVGAIVINTSRGPVIDEAALVEALSDGRLWGAGLDVLEHEPDPAPGLLDHPRVVLTPHIGSGEDRWRGEMTRMCERAAADILAGREPAHRVA
ncbi:MAG: D-glycerate dehydrogenase [Planctomycetota bacterium]